MILIHGYAEAGPFETCTHYNAAGLALADSPMTGQEKKGNKISIWRSSVFDPKDIFPGKNYSYEEAVRTFEESGHNPHLDFPDRLNKLAIDFL